MYTRCILGVYWVKCICYQTPCDIRAFLNVFLTLTFIAWILMFVCYMFS